MPTSRAGTLVTADRAATGGGLRPGQSLERLLTDEGRVHMQAAVDAAARADTRRAYEHTVAGLLVAKSLHQQQLGELLLLGDDAPGWMYSGGEAVGLGHPQGVALATGRQRLAQAGPVTVGAGEPEKAPS